MFKNDVKFKGLMYLLDEVSYWILCRVQLPTRDNCMTQDK